MKSQSERNRKRDKRQSARRHNHPPKTPEMIADKLSRDVKRLVLSATRPKIEQTFYPSLLAEFAEEIQVKGEKAVTAKQRNEICKGLPYWMVTSHDGRSVASFQRNDWD